MTDTREKKLLEFNPEDVLIGKCKIIDTEEGMFKVCRGKKKINIYKIFADL